MPEDNQDDIQIFINEENDIYYSDPDGEVNVSLAILEWLEQEEPEEDMEDFTANLLMVREAALKLLGSAEERIAKLASKKDA